LSRWLGEHRLGVGDVDADCISDLVSARRRAGRSTLASATNFSLLLAYLREIGVVRPEVPRTDPAGEVLRRYRDFLIFERGLGESSITTYLLVAERFCCGVLNRHGEPALLSAAEVTEHIVTVCGRSSFDEAHQPAPVGHRNGILNCTIQEAGGAHLAGDSGGHYWTVDMRDR
jgi:hypothetical protein